MDLKFCVVPNERGASSSQAINQTSLEARTVGRQTETFLHAHSHAHTHTRSAFMRGAATENLCKNKPDMPGSAVDKFSRKLNYSLIFNRNNTEGIVGLYKYDSLSFQRKDASLCGVMYQILDMI